MKSLFKILMKEAEYLPHMKQQLTPSILEN
jgi:hypothetical protein